MKQSLAQYSKKGEGSRSGGSPLARPSYPKLDKDAPIPSIEPAEPEEEGLVNIVRLANLPFYENFEKLAMTARFPNPVDVRNRRDFTRGVSADLSRDPFETRILNNGLKVGNTWPLPRSDRPPFFDDDRSGGSEHADNMMDMYFPGINPYPELRSPPGSKNLAGEHYGYLLMDLYDAEGMLALGEELRTDHVMALIKWQMLDFADIVFVMSYPIEHDRAPHRSFSWKKLKDSQRFIVMVIHHPGHWVGAIYDRDQARLGVINTHPNSKTKKRQNDDTSALVLRYLRAGLPAKEAGKQITTVIADVSPQLSSTNCGWQIANYVTFFFRENRGKENWKFTDWSYSNLARDLPAGMNKEEGMVVIWMFAIRSELNGTGQDVREPVNMPLIDLDSYRAIKSKEGLVSQQAIFNRGLNTVNPSRVRQRSMDRLPTPAMITSVTERFGKIDLFRPIDHRTSRATPAPIPSTRPVEKLLSLAPAASVRALSMKADLGLHPDLTKSPLPVTHVDGQWTTEEGEFNLGSFIKDVVNPSLRKNQPATPVLQSTAPDRGQSGSATRSGSPMMIDSLTEGMKAMTPSRQAGSPAPRTLPQSGPPEVARRNHIIRRHNANFSKWIDTSMTTMWVPMPAIHPDHIGWQKHIEWYLESQNTAGSSRAQKDARDQRAQRRQNNNWD